MVAEMVRSVERPFGKESVSRALSGSANKAPHTGHLSFYEALIDTNLYPLCTFIPLQEEGMKHPKCS